MRVLNGRDIRPTIVNAYGFRRLRSPGLVFPGNAQNPPPYGGMMLLFRELWGEYASGEPSAVTAANWTFGGVATNSTITNGVNQISYFGNSVAFSAHNANAITFNAAKSWEFDFEFDVSGGGTTNNFAVYAEDDGSQNVGFGVIIQADGIDGNLNATLRAAGANVGVATVINPSYTGDNKYRLFCAGGSMNKQLTLFLNGVQVLQGNPVGHVPTGSKNITIAYTPSAAGNAGFIGPLSFKGSKT